MLIQILEPVDYSESAINIYQRLGPVIMGDCDSNVRDRINLLVVRLARQLDKTFLQPYAGLRAIASPTTGLSHIDQQYCRNKNIRIFSLQQAQEEIDRITSTSELAFGLMLSLLRNIPAANRDVVTRCRWNRDHFKSRQLSGLTLGIIGLGRIGGHLARYAQVFGMHVMACDPFVDDGRFNELNVRPSDLHNLCKTADIISIHATETEDNFHLIGQQEINAMKPGALLINTARGSLLDEVAAANALRKKCLGGVACDVLEHETSPVFLQTSPLREAARKGCNVILTPHIGGCTRDAMQATEEILAETVCRNLGDVQ